MIIIITVIIITMIIIITIIITTIIIIYNHEISKSNKLVRQYTK